MMRCIRWLAATTLAAGASLALAQSDYPRNPVKVLVPYPPGGPTDLVTRLFARELSARFNQQFIIENRPGGGTNIAAEAVARSPADGYTLFVVQGSSHGVNPSFYRNLTYDAVKDFASIGQMARTAMFLVANAGLPFASTSDLVNYAKENPGKLNYASQGNGSPGHLAGAMLSMKTGANVVHVPYKGAAPALADLVGGRVQFAFLSFDGPTKGLVKEGKLKVLAVAAANRWPTEPQIPSMIESGLADFEALSFFGLSAPAKTPEPILDRLNRAMLEIARSDETKKRLNDMGLVPLPMSREEMNAFIVREIESWRPVVKATGAQID